MFFDAEAGMKIVIKGLVWRKRALQDHGGVQVKGFFESLGARPCIPGDRRCGQGRGSESE